MRSALSLAVAVLALLVPAASQASVHASAAVPCWKAVQNDWYKHGRVTGHYKLACYTLAIKKLPADVATYSGASADIRRAYVAEKKRLAKLAAKKKHHKK